MLAAVLLSAGRLAVALGRHKTGERLFIFVGFSEPLSKFFFFSASERRQIFDFGHTFDLQSFHGVVGQLFHVKSLFVNHFTLVVEGELDWLAGSEPKLRRLARAGLLCVFGLLQVYRLLDLAPLLFSLRNEVPQIFKVALAQVVRVLEFLDEMSLVEQNGLRRTAIAAPRAVFPLGAGFFGRGARLVFFACQFIQVYQLRTHGIQRPVLARLNSKARCDVLSTTYLTLTAGAFPRTTQLSAHWVQFKF